MANRSCSWNWASSSSSSPWTGPGKGAMGAGPGAIVADSWRLRAMALMVPKDNEVIS